MLRGVQLVGTVMLFSLLALGFAENNPLTESVADRIAMETDALRLPCPTWWVDGVVDLHGSGAYPECILFEYHDVSLVRRILDGLVRYEGLGQWVMPWSRSQEDGANRFLMVSEVGFHVMLWPEDDYHTLVNLTMPPEDVQGHLREVLEAN